MLSQEENLQIWKLKIKMQKCGTPRIQIASQLPLLQSGVIKILMFCLKSETELNNSIFIFLIILSLIT